MPSVWPSFRARHKLVADVPARRLVLMITAPELLGRLAEDEPDDVGAAARANEQMMGSVLSQYCAARGGEGERDERDAASAAGSVCHGVLPHRLIEGTRSALVSR